MNPPRAWVGAAHFAFGLALGAAVMITAMVVMVKPIDRTEGLVFLGVACAVAGCLAGAMAKTRVGTVGVGFFGGLFGPTLPYSQIPPCTAAVLVPYALLFAAAQFLVSRFRRV